MKKKLGAPRSVRNVEYQNKVYTLRNNTHIEYTPGMWKDWLEVQSEALLLSPKEPALHITQTFS